MKALNIPSLLAICGLHITSCSLRNEPTPGLASKNQTWTNKHLGSADLAGVSIQQFPDCVHESPAWDGKHPAMILFVMWDGRVNQVEYEPSGKIRSDWWWDINKEKHDYSYIWNDLDYSHGSDPNFERHQKPHPKANKSAHPTRYPLSS